VRNETLDKNLFVLGRRGIIDPIADGHEIEAVVQGEDGLRGEPRCDLADLRLEGGS
jgi:hypothetical protein